MAKRGHAKIADIRADIDQQPADWRLLHLPTDTIYRYSGKRWRSIGKVVRIDEDLGEDLVRTVRAPTEYRDYYNSDAPGRVLVILTVIDGLTALLNDDSAWFKDHADSRIVRTYDTLKDAFQAVRTLWLAP